MIYCVHALGYMLSNEGLAPPIGNLVGKLEFTEAEIHNTQRGLDASGLKLPNFSLMGDHFGVESEPEPEPEMSEEEILLYELTQCEPEIINLQSVSRGALLRLSLYTNKYVLERSLGQIVQLQSIIRSRKARKIVSRRLKRIAKVSPFVNNIQSAIRGTLLRQEIYTKQHIFSNFEEETAQLQALIRGSGVRRVVKGHFHSINSVTPYITGIQSTIRGLRVRENVYTDKYILARSADRISKLQGIIRGNNARHAASNRVNSVGETTSKVATLQSVIRGKIGRRNLAGFKNAVLAYNKPTVVGLQSIIRAMPARQFVQRTTIGMKSSPATVAPIIVLQAAIRSSQVRNQIQTTKRVLKVSDNSSSIVELQSLIRARDLRQAYTAHRMELRRGVPDVIDLQAIIRGNNARKDVVDRFSMIRDCSSWVPFLQASIRGFMLRQDYFEHIDSIQSSSTTNLATKLQSGARGLLARKMIEDRKLELIRYRNDIILNQSFARGLLERRRIKHLHQRACGLRQIENINRVQAAVRGAIQRKDMDKFLTKLGLMNLEIVELQSALRARTVRNLFHDTLISIHESAFEAVEMQSIIRANFIREDVSAIRNAVVNEEPLILDIQSTIRGGQARQDYDMFMRQIDIHEPAIIRLQSAFRGVTARFQYYSLMEEFYEVEPSVLPLQAIIRSFLVRNAHNERMKYFKSNMDKIIKIQSFVRAKKQGDSYKSLITSPNPPLETVKTFVHLLNDSDLDFEQEVHLEQSRKQVIDEIQHNEQLEQFISQLDVKIALLLKNKITIDEVIRHRNKAFNNSSNYNNTANLALTTPADMFDLKALNKSSRRRLELYQGLFYILQTQPVYFARLFKKLQRSVVSEKEAKEIERLAICLFDGPLPKKRREEYFILKLISRSIEEESTASHNLKSVLRGNFMWWKLLAAMNRSSRERQTLRTLLYSPVMTVITRPDLDLESDPLVIYRKSISDEEIRTGQLSNRNPHISVNEAIRDPDTRSTYISNMQRLRELTTEFLNTLSDNVEMVPYHIRFAARQVYSTCKTLFGEEGIKRPSATTSASSASLLTSTLNSSRIVGSGVSDDRLLTLVGHVVFNLYLNPAIIAADNYGILSSALTPQQTRNLTEVTKMLTQISLLKPFSKEDVYLQPLNDYIKSSVSRMKDVFRKIINIPDVNQQFQMTVYDDLTSHDRPSLHIKTADIFAIHSLVSAELDTMAPLNEDEDESMKNSRRGTSATIGNRRSAAITSSGDKNGNALRSVINELGTLPNDASELLNIAKFSEIKLDLNASLCPIEDPDADINALLVSTKRCLIYVLRVQSGSNLLEILVSPVEDYHEKKFRQLLEEERDARERKRRAKVEQKKAKQERKIRAQEEKLQRAEEKRLARLQKKEQRLLERQNAKVERRQILIEQKMKEREEDIQRLTDIAQTKVEIVKNLEHQRDEFSKLPEEGKEYNPYLPESEDNVPPAKKEERVKELEHEVEQAKNEARMAFDEVEKVKNQALEEVEEMEAEEPEEEEEDEEEEDIEEDQIDKEDAEPEDEESDGDSDDSEAEREKLGLTQKTPSRPDASRNRRNRRVSHANGPHAEHHLIGSTLPSSDHEGLGDLSMMSYRDLKRISLEKILELESLGKVSRSDFYQTLLNSIAFDIRSKRDRRLERAKEMGSVQQTLMSLHEKEQYLEQKLKTYNSYIEQAMVTLQTKKANSRQRKPLLPFSKQYFHMRDLQKSGNMPQFGSYKYSAANMSERGILVELRGIHGSLATLSTGPNGLSVGNPDKQFEKVSLTWSSDKVGVFKIEASFGNVSLPGAVAELTLDELLSQQYNNRQYITLFDNMVTLNTNLTLHFIFKKFYGQGM